MRFYLRKRDNIVSVYQFAIDKDFRWKQLVKKMLEKTWYKTFEVGCYSESNFNSYYEKTWWKLVSDDWKIKTWKFNL